jgi:hypothetical protein
VARKVDLPPAGAERNEVLAERKDALEQAAEETAAALETETIDPDKFKIENEIAQNFDPATTMLKVSNADPTQRYCWVYSGMHGLMVTQKQIEGWLVVQGNDEEALEHKGIGADTTRRVGDTLLMKIPLDKFLIIDRRNRERAARFNEEKSGISDEARRLAKKYGIPIYQDGEVDARTLKRMMTNANAQKIAGRTTDKLIRQGRMPGAHT